MTIGMLGFGEVAQAIFERIGEHWELSIKRRWTASCAR